MKRHTRNKILGRIILGLFIISTFITMYQEPISVVGSGDIYLDSLGTPLKLVAIWNPSSGQSDPDLPSFLEMWKMPYVLIEPTAVSNSTFHDINGNANCSVIWITTNYICDSMSSSQLYTIKNAVGNGTGLVMGDYDGWHYAQIRTIFGVNASQNHVDFRVAYPASTTVKVTFDHEIWMDMYKVNYTWYPKTDEAWWMHRIYDINTNATVIARINGTSYPAFVNSTYGTGRVVGSTIQRFGFSDRKAYSLVVRSIFWSSRFFVALLPPRTFVMRCDDVISVAANGTDRIKSLSDAGISTIASVNLLNFKSNNVSSLRDLYQNSSCFDVSTHTRTYSDQSWGIKYPASGWLNNLSADYSWYWSNGIDPASFVAPHMHNMSGQQLNYSTRIEDYHIYLVYLPQSSPYLSDNTYAGQFDNIVIGKGTNHHIAGMYGDAVTKLYLGWYNSTGERVVGVGNDQGVPTQNAESVGEFKTRFNDSLLSFYPCGLDYLVHDTDDGATLESNAYFWNSTEQQWVKDYVAQFQKYLPYPPSWIASYLWSWLDVKIISAYYNSSDSSITVNFNSTNYEMPLLLQFSTNNVGVSSMTNCVGLNTKFDEPDMYEANVKMGSSQVKIYLNGSTAQDRPFISANYGNTTACTWDSSSKQFKLAVGDVINQTQRKYWVNISVPSGLYPNDNFKVSCNLSSSNWGQSWNGTSRILTVWMKLQGIGELIISGLDTYWLNVKLVDADTYSGLSGKVNGSFTDAGGWCNFSGMSNGTYTLVGSASGYKGNMTTCVVAGNTTFYLTLKVETYTLSVKLVDADNYSALSGTINGTSTTNGWVNFTNLVSGTYSLTGASSGYKSNITSVSITGDTNFTLTLKAIVYTTYMFFNFTPNPSSSGQEIALRGIFVYVDLTNNTLPVANAVLNITYSIDYGLTWNTAEPVTTGSNGMFLKTLNPPAIGVYLFKLSYEGSPSYAPVTSSTFLIVT